MIHVFGCGGHALVALDVLEQQSDSLCFYDDDHSITPNTFRGINFLGL